MREEMLDHQSRRVQHDGFLRQLSSHSLFPVAIVACLGLILRLWNIGNESLWIDESATLRRSRMGLGEMVANSATHGQLPLYNLMMNLWVKLAGTSEVALRLPSALLGSLNVLLAYMLVHRLLWDHIKLPWPFLPDVGQEKVQPAACPGQLRLGRINLDWPLVVALLVATQPVLIYFGQEARTYSLMLSACWVVALTLLVPLRWGRPHHNYETALLSVALSVLVLCHYIGWVMAAGTLLVHFYHVHELGLIAATGGLKGQEARRIRPQWSVQLTRTCLPLIAVILPILLWLGHMAFNDQWPNSSFHRSSSLGETLGQWSSEDFAPLAILLAPLVLAALLGLRALLKTHRPLAGACLLWALGLPIFVVGGAAATQNFFAARYLLPIIVPVLLLAGRGLFEKLPGVSFSKPRTEQRSPRSQLAGPVLLVLILLLALGPTAWLATTSQKPEWREAAAIIDENTESWDLVAVAPDWERDTLDHYLEGDGRPLTVDQAIDRIEDSGPESLADLWVVFRHDRVDERQELEERLGPGYQTRKMGTVYQLEVWWFEALIG